jgi:predicted secreted protein
VSVGTVVKKALILLVAVVLVLGGIVGAYPWKTTSNIQTLSGKLGDMFSVTLDGNASTGYRWEAKFDPAYLELVGDNYTASGSQPGAAGTQLMTFLCKKEGTASLTFQYKRSGESSVSRTIQTNVLITR